MKLGVAAVVCMLVPAMFAGTLAIDFTGVTVDFTNDNWSLGWEFNVTRDIYVTGLGFYDDLQDGLVREHMVGIWDNAQNLLVSGNVLPGHPLQSWWRWVAVPPTLLRVGTNYRIAAATRWESYTWNPIGFATAPEITFVRNRYTLIGGVPGANTLLYPVNSTDVTGFFGPNFQFAFVPVPEPSSLFLLSFGLLGLGAAVRLRQRA